MAYYNDFVFYNFVYLHSKSTARAICTTNFTITELILQQRKSVEQHNNIISKSKCLLGTPLYIFITSKLSTITYLNVDAHSPILFRVMQKNKVRQYSDKNINRYIYIYAVDCCRWWKYI